MTPIHELLHRIRWDPRLRASTFEVGFLDRVTGRLERVGLAALHFDAGQPGGFSVVSPDGSSRFIPFHRVREVSQDGEVIWRRRERVRPPRGSSPGRK